MGRPGRAGGVWWASLLCPLASLSLGSPHPHSGGSEGPCFQEVSAGAGGQRWGLHSLVAQRAPGTRGGDPPHLPLLLT